LFLGSDPSNPLAVQAGYEAGLTADEICPDNGEHAQVKGQGILTPAGGAISHFSAHDVSLVVYEFGGGIVSDICQLVGATVLGTGTANYSLEANFTGQGAFIIHATLQGVIDLVSGGQARVNATARVTILPDGTLLFDEERVRLTPL
jgi:hypothetical protein